MTLDDKRAWLKEHGENRGEGWSQKGHHILWRPNHIQGRSRYHTVGRNCFKGLGSDNDDATYNLFRKIKEALYEMCS